MNITTHEIIDRFLRDFPEVHLAMKKSDHNYSATNTNPYHIEGDVWTHTMMVLNIARVNQYPIEVQLAALLHDVGKAYTREISDRVRDGKEVKYVSYKGHDGVSFYRTIDILQKSYSDILSDEEMFTVAKLVALHSSLYTWQNGDSDVSDDKLKQAYAGDSAFLSLLAKLAHCDADGRIAAGASRSITSNESGKTFLKYEDFVTYPEPYIPLIELADERRSMHVLIGPPCVGKSTWIKNVNATEDQFVIVSRDDIVMKLGEFDTYSENFHSVDQKEVDTLLQNHFNRALKSGKDIVIDMTNMSKKARRKFINPAKRAGFLTEAIVFHVGHKTQIDRNEKRFAEEGKHIPPHVFHNMQRSFAYPLHDEFDVVSDINAL